ncbi:MAG: GAF domain-containing protein [Chloroflexi bacterium]|nr:GAF domain-containing protein [Chloroflexota bacterium]
MTKISELEKRIAELEEDLHQSEKRYRAVTDTALAGIGVTDIEDNLTFVNSTLAKMLGHTLDEMEGMNLSQLMSAEEFKDHQGRTQERAAGGVRDQYESILRHKDGHWISALVSASPLTADDGTFEGTLGVLVDITERKQAAIEVQRQADQMAIIYKMGQRVSGELELEALLSETVTAVYDAFGYYGVMLLLLDEETQCLTVHSVAGKHMDVFPEHTWLAMGEGLIGRAAETGETQISGDVNQDPHYLRKEEEQTNSELAVPIKSGDRVIGVLDLQSAEFDTFGESERVVMEALSTQIATAIENAQLFQDAQVRANRLAVVNRIAKVANATLDLDDLMESVYQEITPTFQADAFIFALYDEDTDELDFRYQVDEGERLPPARVPLGTGLSSIVIAERKPLVIRDFEREQEYVSRGLVIGTGKLPASWLGTPLLVGDRVIGIISVQAYRSYAWDEEDEQLLFTIAEQITVALENVRLLEQAQTRAKESAVLTELGQALTTRLNVDDVLNEAYRQSSRLLDTTNFSVALYDPEKHELAFALAVSELEDEEHPPAFSADRGLSGYTVRQRTALLVERDVEEWKVKMEIQAGKGAMPTLSWLSVPLLVGDRVLGVMSAQSYTTPGAYGERDRDIFIAIASQTVIALQNAQMVENLEQMVKESTAELRDSIQESERLQQEIIEAQRSALQELSTPIIPIMERIMVMPLIGSIDSMRARDITRALLAGIRQYRAKVVILDITGVPIVDSGVANHLNKTIQAARLKGARTIITGISDAVAETIVELGIDWGGIETLNDLQTGLIVALGRLGIKLAK